MAVFDPNTVQVAIVTGAATSIGALTVRALVHRGWRVAILDVLEAAGEELAKELRQSTLFIKCDVASYEQQANAFLKVKQTWGRIDALITNAGVVERSSQYIFRHRGSNELPPEPNTMAIDINFKALIYGIQLAIHFMRQNPTPGGQIVCVASLAGVYGTPIYPEYSGSKAAVVSYTMAAAPVLQRKENIQINTIAPGIVRAAIVPEDLIQANGFENTTSMESIVDTFLYFLDNRGITGQLVEVSGEKRIVLPPREAANGTASKRAAATWGPVFTYVHGEPSEDPDEITW